MSPIHTGVNQQGKLKVSTSSLICRACGTQFDVAKDIGLESCRICDDPRQYVPPSGQSFTTFRELHSNPSEFKLSFEEDPVDSQVTSIRIHPPKLGIGQRALLIRTPHGNLLWDLVAYLDQAAIDHINNTYGGLSAIIISHPHFYTTWADWSASFSDIPVYLAAHDEEWICRRPANANLHLLTNTHTEILPGVTAIICGGHFPGSMALHTRPPNTQIPSLFHADTIHTVPNAFSPKINTELDRNSLQGQTSYTFMWSIPNMIPLGPREIMGIWRALQDFEIEATYGFQTVRWRDEEDGQGKGVRLEERILESMKVCVRKMGWKEDEAEILRETIAAQSST